MGLQAVLDLLQPETFTTPAGELHGNFGVRLPLDTHIRTASNHLCRRKLLQIYSADIAELCGALSDLLRSVKANLRGSPLDGDLWSYERVVWRDVIAAFGLVPDPRKCWSKPTHPRTVKRKNCIWDDVHGLIDGSVTFQPWDLWWWRDARDWPALVQRYMSAYKDLPRNVRRELAEATIPLGSAANVGPRTEYRRAPATETAPPADRAEYKTLPDWGVGDLGYMDLLNTIKLNLRIYEHVNGTTNTTTYYYMVLTSGGHTYKARKQRQFGAPAVHNPPPIPTQRCAGHSVMRRARWAEAWEVGVPPLRGRPAAQPSAAQRQVEAARHPRRVRLRGARILRFGCVRLLPYPASAVGEQRSACSAAAFYGCVGLRDLVDEHGTEVRGVAPVLGAGPVPEIEIDHERVRQQAGYDIQHRDPTSQPHYFARSSDRP
jgi:hypothetical protein